MCKYNKKIYLYKKFIYIKYLNIIYFKYLILNEF